MRIQRAKKPNLSIAWHIGLVRGCGNCLQVAFVDLLALRDMERLLVTF
jgi:hypothetical protein